MSRERDVDQLIQTFMQEGPAELSTRLLDGIRDDVHGTKQRTLRRPWRTPSMPRPMLIFAALGALLVAIAAMTIVETGGRAVPSTPPASPSSSAVSSPSQAGPAVVPYPLADGEAWIAFPGGENGGASLVRPDGTGHHAILGELADTVVNLAWSPDGQRLAIEANGDRGSHLWVANADGTGARMLTETIGGCPDADCTEAIHPAWSPDGATIAYVAPRHQAGVYASSALMTIDVSTGTPTTLYTTTDANLGRPTWSPNSRRIAFEVDRFAGRPEDTPLSSTVVAIYDLDGGPRVQPAPEVTEAAALAGYPGWHPTDANLLVVRTNPYDPNTVTMLDNEAPSDLYTLRLDDLSLTKVTDEAVGGAIIRAPSWTPDGRILFSKLVDKEAPEELRVIQPDGTGEASATGAMINNGEGRWRPGT